MRSLVSTPDGPNPAEIQEVDEPVPGPDEVLLEVKAASINRGELSLLPARVQGGSGMEDDVEGGHAGLSLPRRGRPPSVPRPVA